MVFLPSGMAIRLSETERPSSGGTSGGGAASGGGRKSTGSSGKRKRSVSRSIEVFPKGDFILKNVELLSNYCSFFFLPNKGLFCTQPNGHNSTVLNLLGIYYKFFWLIVQGCIFSIGGTKVNQKILGNEIQEKKRERKKKSVRERKRKRKKGI